MIIDASVIVALLLKEPAADRARDLLFQAESLSAPEILMDEVFNALSGARRKKILTEKSANSAAALWQSQIEERMIAFAPLAPIRQRAWELSQTLNHAYYDCLYLALAEQKGAPLVTADGVFAKKAKGQGTAVHLLA